ncbi:cellulose binding domain-containing protein [Streptomyces sp. NPDC085946]|uniref:cellulose binding domain-containing protein n=1 Tax=Streptomyces sp. NPDC085946 TaxID=3365744 RepID=UPI0037CED75F
MPFSRVGVTSVPFSRAGVTSAPFSRGAATDGTAVTVHDVVRADGKRETRVATTGSAGATVTGPPLSTEYALAVHARDAAGNRSARSTTVRPTTRAASTASGRAAGHRPGGRGDRFDADATVRDTGTTAVRGGEPGYAFPGEREAGSASHAEPVRQGEPGAGLRESWTGTIPAGGPASFGINGSSAGPNGAPASSALNGTAYAKS